MGFSGDVGGCPANLAESRGEVIQPLRTCQAIWWSSNYAERICTHRACGRAQQHSAVLPHCKLHVGYQGDGVCKLRVQVSWLSLYQAEPTRIYAILPGRIVLNQLSELCESFLGLCPRRYLPWDQQGVDLVLSKKVHGGGQAIWDSSVRAALQRIKSRRLAFPVQFPDIKPKVARSDAIVRVHNCCRLREGVPKGRSSRQLSHLENKRQQTYGDCWQQRSPPRQLTWLK
mmetsp:Transcript_77176/g.124889  ORF Transcript_77176/g.124889 Transcript_77176/m.124889 type:complete len:229 (-) Transcript_77176:52-738(-)